MNLLEKVQHPEHRKPTYRWLGAGHSHRKPANVGHDERKRLFGADITTVLKRIKVDIFSTENLNHTKNVQTVRQMKHENMDSEQDPKQGLTGYQFGPFASVNLSDIVTSENDVQRFHDWENLVTVYRPHYHNPALSDLFAHYSEAWSSWYSKVPQRPNR